MAEAELKKQVEELQKIVEKQKKRVKNQNEAAKERWQTVSCRLPKGTKERIENHGLTINGLINNLVLAELDRLDAVKAERECPSDMTDSH